MSVCVCPPSLVCLAVAVASAVVVAAYTVSHSNNTRMDCVDSLKNYESVSSCKSYCGSVASMKCKSSSTRVFHREM